MRAMLFMIASDRPQAGSYRERLASNLFEPAMHDLLADYPPPNGAYHELLDAKGNVRPHWRRLYEQLARSRPEHLAQREAMLARQIQETASPTTSTPIRMAPTARGNWTCCPT